MRKESDEPPQRLGIAALVAMSVLIAILPVYAWSNVAQNTMTATPIPTGWLGATLGLILLVILLNAIFVAADTALELLKPTHVRAVDGTHVRTLQTLLDRQAHYIAACTLGSQTMRAWMMILSFVPAPWVASLMSAEPTWGTVLISGVIVTVPVAALNVVFGEIIPKTFASKHPHRLALRTQGLIRASGVLFSPFIAVLLGSANLFTRRFGTQASFALPNQAEDEIRSLVESAHETGEIEVEEREMLDSVFEFGDTVAREVMTPRVDLDAAPVTIEPNDLLKLIQTSGRSRIPIYEETDDQIVGIIHAKDLMATMLTGTPLNVRSLVRAPYFVPENKPLHDLLREMRTNKTQLVIVQDEFGGTAGVVTMEDIVEEIVGDIQDEYDNEVRDVETHEDGWIIQGRTNLYDVNDEIGSSLASGEFDTLGGFVFGLFGRQPTVGESLEHEGYRFTVHESDGRRILKVHVERLPSDLGEQLEQALTS